jgi:FixJ family two-component response regulator
VSAAPIKTRLRDLQKAQRKVRYPTRGRRTAIGWSQQVVALVTAGRMNKQPAFNLGLSEITVKPYRGRVMQKMAAQTFADLVRMAKALGLQGSSKPTS